MGGNQSIPKITPQDRAILEYVSLMAVIVHELIRLETSGRRMVAKVSSVLGVSYIELLDILMRSVQT